MNIIIFARQKGAMRQKVVHPSGIVLMMRITVAIYQAPKIEDFS